MLYKVALSQNSWSGYPYQGGYLERYSPVPTDIGNVFSVKKSSSQPASWLVQPFQYNIGVWWPNESWAAVTM